MRPPPWHTLHVAAGLLVVSAALIVLAGWALGVEILKRGYPSGVAVMPNTAIGLLLSGVALWLIGAEGTRATRWLGRGLAGLVVVMALLTLAEGVLDLDLGIDRLAYPLIPADSFPARPAPLTALALALEGGALLLVGVRARAGYAPSDYLAMAAGVPALLALLGHSYGMAGLRAISPYTGTALPTAAALLLLSIGIVFARPGEGLAAIVTSGTAGGVLLRRMLLPMIAMPPVVGALRLLGQRAGLYGNELGTALTATISLSLIAALLFFTARRLHLLDLQRRAARSQLRESERKYREHFERSLAGMFRTTADGRVLDCNAALARTLGHGSVEDVKRQGAAVFYADPEDRRRLLADVAAQGAVDNRELRFRRGDGSEMWARISVAQVTGRDGPCFEGQLLDVTERRKVEERVRAFLESSPDATVVVAPDGRIAQVNLMLERVFGYSRAELLGRPVEILVPDSLREGHVERRDGYVAEPKARPMAMGLELQARRRDGTTFPVEISLSPVTTQEGLLVIAAIRDVSDRKLVEEARHAQEVLKTVKALALAAGHEINNPLTPLVAGLELLRVKVQDDPAGLRRLETALRSAGRIHEIVVAMSHITSIEMLRVPGSLPPTLDIRASAGVGGAPPASPPEAPASGSRGD